MTVKTGFWYVITGAIYIAIIMLLVRPSSKGPQVIGQVLDALSDLLKGTTGYGSQS